ncbi:MAG TPA: tol-pal system protein YbgF [Thermoanaerobaculia bacterium]|nr:tol-pal system protein YbgF [Thermoanaerobaculia bacterium]
MLAASLALASAFLGCSSSSELERVRLQIGDLQRQLLQLQAESPSRASVEQLEAVLREDLAKLVRASADVAEELRRVGLRIETLGANLADNQRSFAELSAQIAVAQEELENLAQVLAQRGVSGSERTQGTPTSYPSDPQELYQAAYNDYLRGNYDPAIVAFRQFIASFPASQLADNAQYWIGECYFHQQKFREAVAEFSRVESSYPTSERLASSLLRKGYALIELGDSASARRALLTVVQRFPRSDDAILAQRQLDTLGGTP